MMDEPARTWNQPCRFAVIELTNRCNLRCPHCASNSGEARARELPTTRWLTVLDDLAALGGEEVTLIGGEVFLHRDWLQIARHARTTGLKLAIVTNGLLVSDRVYDQLLELDLERLGISLDGATPETYRQTRGVDGFARVWSLLERVRDDGRIPVSAITTLSRLNLHELDALATRLGAAGLDWQVQFASSVSQRFDEALLLSTAEFAAACRRLGDLILDLGDDNFIAPMDDFGYFPLDPDHAPLHAEWEGCQAGRQIIGIRANGDLLGCLSLGDPFVETSLGERSLREVWHAPDAFAELRREDPALTGPCARCPMAERCRAGCRAMAWSATGRITENPYCLRRIECDELLDRMDL